MKATTRMALLGVSAALGACSLVTAQKVISQEANVTRTDSGCKISLSGMFPAVHTLFPGDRKYPGYADIDVPHLKGPFNPEQVRVMLHGEHNKPYEVRYLNGTMTFSESSISIDFTQTLPGADAMPFRFNGTYKLVNDETCA